MIPKEVCHYTKKEIALENILFDKQLRLSRMGLTNDPREFGSWKICAHMIDGDFATPPNILNEFNGEVNRVRANEWKVLCVTLHRSSAKRIHDERKRYIKEKFGPGYSRSQMWAHYADNNSGVCLVFDGKKLHENLIRTFKGRDIKYGKVLYRDNNSIAPNSIDIKYLTPDSNPIVLARSYVRANYKDLFLRKYPDWENETEYRWLVHSPDNLEEHLYISIEGIIKAVYVGIDFPKAYEPSIRALCEELSVPVKRMEHHHGFLSPSQNSIYEP
jgi:hypothetical protein